MADKVLIPGAFGLVNYRPHFSRPILGTVTVRGRGSQARMRYAGRGRWAPYNPAPYIPIHANLANQVATYVGTNTQTRKKSKSRYKKRCCRYIKGKKRCSPKYCGKKFKYSKKFYWY